MNEFRNQWPTIWERIQASVIPEEVLADMMPSWNIVYMSRALAGLDSLYSAGIIPTEQWDQYPSIADRGVRILLNQVVETRQPGNTYDPRSAYDYLQGLMTDSLSLRPLDSRLLSWVFKEVGFNRYLEPNLQADVSKNQEIERETIASIGPTRGIVQQGQRIIGEGDVVNDERFLLLESYRNAYEKELGDSWSRWLIRIGQFLMVLVCISALLLYLFHYRHEILTNNVKTTFIFLLLVLNIFGGAMISGSETISMYLVPFVIFPVILRSFYDARTALFFHLVAMMIIGFLVPNSFEFITMQILAGFAAIISFQHLHRRGQLVMTSIIVFITYLIIYSALALMHTGSFTEIEPTDLAWLAGNSLLVLVSYPLIYVFEKVFGFVSDVTLIELSDTNHPLLRKMAEEAPGTFQHSLQVANLAESVIREIGGNPLLVRTGAMYHDIGKTENPVYFTENQAGKGNPHDQMKREDSAAVIISHVTRGMELARKHRLPQPVIDFIPTHHGTSKAQYFLKMQKIENPESEVDESRFAYPGPRPQTKETAVLMMADSIEAASRSLPEYSKEKIEHLVDQIIDHQFNEGQFNDSEITFRDITVARAIFKKKLTNIYHARIVYPK